MTKVNINKPSTTLMDVLNIQLQIDAVQQLFFGVKLYEFVMFEKAESGACIIYH